MSRKPVHLSMIGGKSPRQRIWEAIRALRDGFFQVDIVRHAKVAESVVSDYVKCLHAGGFVSVIDKVKVGSMCVKKFYQLDRDNGLEAPRLTKRGLPVTQGCGNDAMWGTLRRMFKNDAVDHRQLAAFASTSSFAITPATANTYLQALHSAGYLECVTRSVQGKQAAPARYRLLPTMDSGARAPMIQRTKSVFDPNWNKTVWAEKEGLENE